MLNEIAESYVYIVNSFKFSLIKRLVSIALSSERLNRTRLVLRPFKCTEHYKNGEKNGLLCCPSLVSGLMSLCQDNEM